MQALNQVYEVPIDLIDPPKEATRQSMDEEGLHQLAESIKTAGLVNPVLLRKTGQRYEIIAGHRRLVAHQMLNRLTIKAIIENLDAEAATRAKVHENLCREDVNPVDEAIFIAQAMEDLKMSSAEFAGYIKRNRAYVKRRLALLDYQDDLRTAVKHNGVPLNVARYLSQITDSITRKMYINYAIDSGVTARTARYWLQQYLATGVPNEIRVPPPSEPGESLERRTPQVHCELCSVKDDVTNMVLMYAHRSCRDIIQNATLPPNPKAQIPPPAVL